MKTIGLIGGMSWESTTHYYTLINQAIKQKLGGLHSAKIAMYSIDFYELQKLQHDNNWHAAAELVCEAARKVELAGAHCILICANTMHKVIDEVSRAVNIPILHIADATAEEIKKNSINTVGLLGTAFTMEEDFYKGKLINSHGLKVITPNQSERKIIHKVIYEELCLGKINPSSKKAYLDIINNLVSQGAKGIILGCTEIGMLIQQVDTEIKLFDTTAIHAEAAVRFALVGE